MSKKTKTQNAAKSASYCPHCQRVFRSRRFGSECPADGTTLIGLGDPLPSRMRSLMPMSVTLSVAVFVGLGLAAF